MYYWASIGELEWRLRDIYHESDEAVIVNERFSLSLFASFMLWIPKMPDQDATAAADCVDFSVVNQQNYPINIRLQNAFDLAWVEDLHSRSFGPGRFARTAFRVREMLDTDPSLCLIAQLDDKRVGSVWMTPISLSQNQGYLLGPLAIDPDCRSQGIGRLLVNVVTRLALLKHMRRFVVLVGDAPYYAPLGYRVARAGNILFPGPVDPKRILVSMTNVALISGLKGKIAR